MNRFITALSAVAAFAMISAPARAENDNTEARLRDALRATTLQLRDVQGQIATLQADKAAADEKNTQLETQVKALIKQASADHDANTQTIATWKEKSDEQAAEIASLKKALSEAQSAGQKANTLAATTEAARASFEQKSVELQRQVDDLRAKNGELFKLGNKILDRYANFSIGDALKAREPFVGLARVKLENLVQDYTDKLLDQRVKP